MFFWPIAANDPSSIDALASALQDLAGDETKRRAMGLNGKLVVDDTFRFERFAEVQAVHLERHLGFEKPEPRAEAA